MFSIAFLLVVTFGLIATMASGAVIGLLLALAALWLVPFSERFCDGRSR